MNRPTTLSLLLSLVMGILFSVRLAAQPIPSGGVFSYVGEVTATLLMSSWSATTVGIADSNGGEAIYVTASMWCGAHNAFIVQIDPDTNSLQGTAYLIPGSGEFTIWGTTMGRDSALYLSVKETENIYRFDLRSKTFSNLGPPPFPICANAVYSMATDRSGTIYFASYAGSLSCGIHLGSYDPSQQTMAYLGLIDTTNRYPHSLATTDSSIYLAASTEQRKLFRFDLTSQTVHQLLPSQYCCGPGFADVGRNDWGDLVVFLENTGNGQRNYCFLDSITDSLYNCSPVSTPVYSWAWPRLTDGTRILVNGSSMKLAFKDQGNVITTHPFTSTKSSSCSNTMATAADSNIYVGVQPMAMVRVDPVTGAITHLGNPTGTTGQIYSMTTQDSLLWMASYPNGNLSVLNLHLPYALIGLQAGTDSSDNPRSLGDINNFQERPFAITTDHNGDIFMAIKADYGSSTGSLTRYEPGIGNFTIYQPYSGKAIHGLASVGNHLWGVSEDRLFQWDILNAMVTYDTLAPCINGKHTRIVYSPVNQTLYGICNGPDKLFWAYDPIARQFLTQTVLDSMDATSYSEHFTKMALGPDGLVYGHFSNAAHKSSHLYVVNPQTHQPQIIGRWDADTSGLTGAPLWNGIAFFRQDIYLPSGSHVVRFHKDYPVAIEPLDIPHARYSVFPNPAHDILLAPIPDGLATGASWKVLDLTGRLMLSGVVDSSESSDQIQIVVRSLANGTYIFEGDFVDRTVASRIIVMH